MTTPHPRADILRAIADGKTVQMLDDDNVWVDVDLEYIADNPESIFRIKPDTITTHGHEVPAPVRTPLEVGTPYWQPRPDSVNLQSPWLWSDHAVDELLLERNLVQLTRDGAIAQAQVMIAAYDLLAALQEIADHHEHQRILWTEDLEDADNAEYHKARRDFALEAIAKAIGDEVARARLKFAEDFLAGKNKR